MKLKKLDNLAEFDARVVSIKDKPLAQAEPLIQIDSGYVIQPGEYEQWQLLDGAQWEIDLCRAIGMKCTF